MTVDATEILDLRGLEAPFPMLAILKHIATPTARTVEVLLPHYPILLLPELEQRGWTCEVVSHDLDCCRCRIAPPEGP